MALPNDSHTTGTNGSVFPTQLVAGKEYPVGIAADQDGHIVGSLPAFGLVIPPSAVGAGKLFFDMHNGTTANIVRMKKIFAIVPNDAAVTGALGVRLDVFRTNSVGTGGTVASTTASASTTAPVLYAFNSNVAVPTGITARVTATAGAASQQYLFPGYVFTEETSPQTQMSQYYDLLPELSSGQTIELIVGQGLKVVQGTVASVGTIGFYVVFTVE